MGGSACDGSQLLLHLLMSQGTHRTRACWPMPVLARKPPKGLMGQCRRRQFVPADIDVWPCLPVCLQGSNWSRSRFDFVTHNRNPSTVTATAQPQDVWLLSSCMQQDSSSAGDTSAGSSQGMQLSGVQLSDKLSATGQYVLYCDRPGSMTVTQGLKDGLALQLSPAESDVVTVAPVLQITAGGASSAASSSRDGAGTVLCAVVGLVNMLNPGGAVSAIQAGQQQQCLRSSDGSNNGGSGNDSGSWVMAAADQSLPVAQAAGGLTGGLQQASLLVKVTGCGELLLYCTVAPDRVELDGEPVGFSFDAVRHRLAVIVPMSSRADFHHEVCAHWQCI